MRKSTLLVVVMTMMGSALMAAPVSQETAHRVAVNFWNTYRPVDVKAVSSMQNYSFPELQHLYVFVNGENQGFVIVANDDRVRPVVGYSFDSPFPTRLHPELRYWLSGYEEQIAYAATIEGAADPRWSTLLDGDVPPMPLSLANVPMLCQTRWDQGDPFNRLCPYDSIYNDRAVVGCVATAMAQIMKRWEHPSCGTGSHAYMHQGDDGTSYGILSADFEHTTYMWQLMPNIIPVTTSEDRAMAVSTISYHCGVAVDMIYGTHATGGSGAYSTCGWWASACAEHAFYEYFKYKNTLQHFNRDDFSDSVWLAMIDEDLANGRPLYYSGSDYSGGHAFVLDGSNLDTTYHFNWGWSGYGDGFYAMNNLAPGSGGAGGNVTYSFNIGQGAIFGIEPLEERFDTVTVYDTICRNYESYQFYEYTLPVESANLEVRHLDTIFDLHLTVVDVNDAFFSSNTGGLGQMFSETYCFVDSLVLPECPYTRKKKYFYGWCRDNHGNAAIYQPGEKVGVRGNVSFYAIWKDSSTLAIREVEDVVSLWPNPTTGEVTVTLGEGHVAQVMVLDAVGREVFREDSPNPVHGGVKLSLQGLPVGVYTLQVKTSAGVYNRRIIKR